MIGTRFIPVVWKQVVRHRTRSILTALGVAVAMFLFVAVQALQAGVDAATRVTANDTTLVVYRENRFCPATSRLPEHYSTRIAKVAGVSGVVPMQIVVNNCGASLDVITFRGINTDDVHTLASKWKMLGGSIDAWRQRSDAALVGERLAARRGFQVGDTFDSSGVTVTVAGILASEEAQDQNVAYVQLPYLQRAAARAGVGSVTQFIVRVSDSSALESVAKAIDAEFRNESEPTQTRPEKAFVAQAGDDIVLIVGFTRWLGWGCLVAVLALVANSIVLSVQDRVKEHAILQTLGFRGGLIARLIIAESVLLGLLGGAVGTAAAWVFATVGRFSLSNEGLSVNVTADAYTLALGVGLSAGVGVLAGLVPAFRASRREIAHGFRAI